MTQVGRNVTDVEDGVLAGKRYLIHDRDPLFTADFLAMIGETGVKSVKLPPRSPNLNAHAERFARSIKESCLDQMIFFGEDSLRNGHSRVHGPLSSRTEPPRSRQPIASCRIESQPILTAAWSAVSVSEAC
jgi:hypothetical protein